MTAQEAIYKVKNRLPRPQLRRDYNPNLLIDILNDTLKTIVIPDLFRIGGFFYLNDYTQSEAIDLTAEDNISYYDISSLTRLYAPSLTAWVCESSPSTESDVIDDGYLVDMRGHNFVYDAQHYDMGYYRRKVLGRQDNATLWIYSADYSYGYIKYIQEPEDYVLEGELGLTDSLVSAFLLPAMRAETVLVDSGFPTYGAWRKKYLNNLDTYEANILKKMGAKRFRPMIRYHGQLGFRYLNTGRYG